MTANEEGDDKACEEAKRDALEQQRRAKLLRKVYGRGFYDGLRAATGEHMTPAKNKAALQGQSAIAMKVYDATPIAEAWAASKICGELAKSCNVNLSIVRGCLNSLIDSGLVREVARDTYQRVKVRDAEVSPLPADPVTERPTLTLATMKTKATPAADVVTKVQPLDALSDIASRLRGASTVITSIAAEIENIALTIEEGDSATRGEIDKLRQLQGLLKSLSLA